MSNLPESKGLLIIPRLRIQNANAISSAFTHGFPSITAFLGLAWALERKLAPHMSIGFDSVGVICHDYEEQVAQGGFTKTFCLTRNPIDKSGTTAAIVEEGRIHLDITLIFGISGEVVQAPNDARRTVAYTVADTIEQMRVAGGTIIPRKSGKAAGPSLLPIAENEAEKQFRSLRRRWLPGFTLASRDDLLEQRLQQLRHNNPTANALDAWLDLSGLRWSSQRVNPDSDSDTRADWRAEANKGWLVPIPVGYGALFQYPANTVINSRDPNTPFSFVESIHSIGEWLSPHRLHSWRELMWYGRVDKETGLYRAYNDYAHLKLDPTLN